jgi:hypothetical protein
MRDSSKRVLLGMVSGGLVSTGLVWAFFLWLLNRIFIVGLQSPTALLVLLFPMLLVAAGTTLAIRAIRFPGTVQTWRMLVGTLIVLAPLLVMAALPLFGVLLGSFGDGYSLERLKNPRWCFSALSGNHLVSFLHHRYSTVTKCKDLMLLCWGAASWPEKSGFR